VDKDPRFARIGRATTPHETLAHAKGLEAQLLLIDGEREDGQLSEVVTQARASGRSRIIAVHVGQTTTATPDELTAAGADAAIKKAGRPGILDKAAELVGDPDMPF